jgi:hypothetical protein
MSMFDGFEHHSEPLLPASAFAWRMVRFGGLALSMIGVSLLLGMFGYHALEELTWIDAFLNAAMILSGMGPVSTLQSAAGKLFAGCYALFSGIVFLGAVGVLLAPIAHRIRHRFHLADADDDESDGSS